MKLTTKVILLSLLVLPGAGHLALKRYVVAAGFITSVVYLLLGFFKDINNKIQHVIDNILEGKIPMETSAIRQALLDQGVLENSNLSTIGYLLLIIWVMAAFDAYRIAKKDNKNSQLDSIQ